MLRVARYVLPLAVYGMFTGNDGDSNRAGGDWEETLLAWSREAWKRWLHCCRSSRMWSCSSSWGPSSSGWPTERSRRKRRANDPRSNGHHTTGRSGRWQRDATPERVRGVDRSGRLSPGGWQVASGHVAYAAENTLPGVAAQGGRGVRDGATGLQALSGRRTTRSMRIKNGSTNVQRRRSLSPSDKVQ